MNENKEEKKVDFLEDEPEEGQVYIKPRLETKLTDKKKKECRDIVLEIKNFGVNQRQILYIIDLLALELERNEDMRRIREAVVGIRQELPDTPLELNKEKPKLILG